MRYTIKDVEVWFERTAKLFGRSTVCYTKKEDGTLEASIGAWKLDGTYCGYVIHEIVNKSGGVDCPFSIKPLPAKEFCETMYQIQNAIGVWQKQKEGVK